MGATGLELNSTWVRVLIASELNHLGPFFGFVGDQLAELSRRSRERHAAEVSETGVHLGVGKSRVDLLVELVDDLGRRVPGAPMPYHMLAS
jgi:hypothetical protein